MNVLVIGSGGREHALVWKIRQSPQLGKLYCAPGNPGMEELAECSDIPVTDLQGLLRFALQHEVDLTVVGPEKPLALGIVDLFEGHGLRVFGPTRQASQLEWSKAFAKAFMQRTGIPTARFRIFAAGEREPATEYLGSIPYPVVLKEDGLAAGKGVVVCDNQTAARETLRHMMAEGSCDPGTGGVVIEEYMSGEEASIFSITDGTRYVTLAPAQDHKRVFDGDRGKNTGGMGAYAPAPVVTPEIMGVVRHSIIEPTLRGMAAEGSPYKGCLYVGLMITSEGPKVVEYNARFGDPEAQVVLPLYRGDILELMVSASDGKIDERLSFASPSTGSAVCVVLASGGYPDRYETGKSILGLGSLPDLNGIVAFHAGTKREGNAIVTAGGRVLGMTAIGETDQIGQTVALAYDGVRRIRFEGMHYRKDIGARAIARDPSAYHTNGR